MGVPPPAPLGPSGAVKEAEPLEKPRDPPSGISRLSGLDSSGPALWRWRMEPWIKAVLSLGVVAVSLYVIVTRTDDEAARQWAVGIIALVLGYYLRDSQEHLSR